MQTSQLSWDGDNRVFVVDVLMPWIPNMPDDVRQVIRWAYGYDGAERSYEQESDGTSIMPDWFMGSLLKEPFSVGHDMLFILHHEKKADPVGHIWTLSETNVWYRTAQSTFGYSKLSKWRYAELQLASWLVWNGYKK